MNKLTKTLLIAIAGLLMLAAGYYLWVRQSDRQPSVWQMIPGTAVAVYETQDLSQDLTTLEGEPALHLLSQLGQDEVFDQRREFFEHLAEREIDYRHLLQEQPFWLSWHVTSRNGFDGLFYLPLSEDRKMLLNTFLEKIINDKAYQTQVRKYLDFKITEIRQKESGQFFSYVFYENYLIGSFTPLLVEDIIRVVQENRMSPFKEANADVFADRQLVQKTNRLYVNYKELSHALEVFTKQPTAFSRLFALLGEEALLETNYSKDQLLLTGFSYPDRQSAYLTTFQGQQAGVLKASRYLPNRTALFFHAGFKDVLQWQTKLESYWKVHKPGHVARRLELAEDKQFDFKRYFELSGSEVGLATLESVDALDADQLLFVEVRDTAKMKQFLNSFTQTLEQSRYTEEYEGKQLMELPVEDFTSLLYGDLFGGFDQLFYMFVDDFLVMGNDIRVLKSYLSDRAAEYTWGRSLEKNDFLQQLVADANLSVFIQTARSWEMLKAQINPEWEEVIQRQTYRLKSVDMLALQFSQTDGKFYTSFTARQKGQEALARYAPRFVDYQSVYAQAPLVISPYVVRNHRDGSREVMMQDSLLNLYLVSSEGQTLWTKKLEEQIVDEVRQIDYYDNGKLQYLFATAHALHIIDREGNYVSGYPRAMPEGVRLEFLQLIDYDGSKRYRFLAAAENGDLYMFDKGGVKLEGWRPRKMKSSLAVAPFHIRVRGRDRIVAVQEDGLIQVFNRRGFATEGFPLDLKNELTNPLFVEQGTSFSKTLFTTVTPGGMLYTFNLKGEVLKKEQFYRPSAGSLFKMSIDALGHSFIMARQQMNNLSILNHKGELLFEKDFVTPENIAVQYYDFGSGHEIYAITDPVQEFTYLYDHRGELVNQRPVESAHPIGLLYFEHLNRYYLYHNYNSEFKVRVFSI